MRELPIEAEFDEKDWELKLPSTRPKRRKSPELSLPHHLPPVGNATRDPGLARSPCASCFSGPQVALPLWFSRPELRAPFNYNAFLEPAFLMLP
jgi:hypothetical protein